ncbi:MAG: Arc family DNA-binding protein [Verrucomicrobia bacterium]|nr:Arc family DNA-binding protein [Verrucomicrobiota bacterium]MCH8512665.1 Arc family DNA-binding protein [Kiritimatiellia bacterium]
MNTITIKNVPPAMHRILKERAKVHGRSLNKEVIATLEGSLHASPIDGDAIGRHARAVRESLGVYMTEQDLNEFKEAGRR